MLDSDNPALSSEHQAKSGIELPVFRILMIKYRPEMGGIGLSDKSGLLM